MFIEGGRYYEEPELHNRCGCGLFVVTTVCLWVVGLWLYALFG